MTLEQLQDQCLLLLRALDYGLINEEFHNNKLNKLFSNIYLYNA